MGNLVLRRREGEEIIIDEQTRIRIVSSKGGSCRLAIDAPPSVRIRRAELPPFEEKVIQETAFALRIAK